MYKEVGSFDAKATLSALLRDVENGACYTITLRGRPIADLIPTERLQRENAEVAIEAMRSFPRIKGVAAKEIESLIAEGRK